MVVASHAYKPHECELIILLKIQKTVFEVMGAVESGKKKIKMGAADESFSGIQSPINPCHSEIRSMSLLQKS